MRWMVGAVVGMTSLASLGLAVAPGGDGTRTSTLRYRAQGNLGYRVREVTGPVTHSVHGVPAAPVDSFCYDGAGRTPVKGSVVIECDPATDQGDLHAEWVDENGEWTLDIVLFLHPEHPSGVRIDRTITEIDTVINDPIISNVYLHGDTLAGMPVLPTVHATLAAWGLAKVTLNGHRFDNPIDGTQLPLWDAHIMVTNGVRDINDGMVRTWDGRLYNMNEGSNGYQDPDDMEFHLVFHDGRYPTDATNFPPLFEFFYHLVFEEVDVSIRHTQPLQ